MGALDATREMLSALNELQLAVACAIWPPSDHRNAAIRRACNAELDWTRFQRVVKRQGLWGLVNHGLKQARPDIPEVIAAQASTEAAQLLHQSLSNAAESVRLQRLFDDAGVQVLFLKGASLAMLAYANVGLRSSKDIDILVSPDLVQSATEIITHAGYRRFDPPLTLSDDQLRILTNRRKDFGFIHEVTGHRVELHWRPFLNPHIMGGSPLMAQSRAVSLGGSAILRTMVHEDLFCYLCVHGSLHWWNRIKWLADVGAMLAAENESGIEKLWHAAETRSISDAAALAMLLCQELLGSSIPATVSRQWVYNDKLQWMKETAMGAMTAGRGERLPHDEPFGTTRGAMSAFLLGSGWRYHLIELKMLLTNERDILEFPLPYSIRFLYPIMRGPLWVRRQVARQKAK